MTATDFLSALWPNPLPENGRILVWTLADKQSAYFCDTESAAQYAEASTGDTYVAAGLAPAGLKSNQRAKAVQVLGIPGLWIDIDIADPAHKKPNLPNATEARKLIADFSQVVAPNITVHSGHGYQLWWLFDEPWLFGGDTNAPKLISEERKQAAALAKRWNDHLRDIARGFGWDLDSVYDLARVMRLPGTTNHKGDPAVPVVVKRWRKRTQRHSEWITATEGLTTIPPAAPKSPRAAAMPPGGVVTQGALKLDPSAKPPWELWEVATTNDPMIRKTFDRKRTVRDYPDQSASSYDMGLASYMVALGWDDQQITDLLIFGRFTHGNDLKLREDYYQRTIDLARLTVTVAAPVAEDEDTLATLGGLWGVRINRVIEYSGDPETYAIELDRDDGLKLVNLGQVDTLMVQSRFRNTLARSAHVVIPKAKGHEWDRIVARILKALVTEDIGPDTTPMERVAEWVHEYLQVVKPTDDPDELDDAILLNRPWLSEDGRLHLNLSALRTWLRASQGEQTPQGELARSMRQAGWVRRTIHVAETTKSVWDAPG